MLSPPTHRCCRHHHHAAATFPNALLLPLKLHFHKAAASTAKLAAANVLLPPPPLPPRGRRRATTPTKKIPLTNLFFAMMAMAARSSDGYGATSQQRWQWIALMLWSDECDVNSSIKPYKKSQLPNHASPPPFVFSYAVTKNCIITVLWLWPRHLFSWQFCLPSAYFWCYFSPGGMLLLIY